MNDSYQAMSVLDHLMSGDMTAAFRPEALLAGFKLMIAWATFDN